MTDVALRQLRIEISHWRQAIDALGDLETVASPAAWESLEQYLHDQVRSRLTALTGSLSGEAMAVALMVDAGRDPTQIRQAVLRLRSRYFLLETLLDFFGDAVNSRTNPALGELLRGYDVLAGDSMATVLSPLGINVPPALVYQDKGRGAAILRAGIRLWDGGHLSPAAAIKLTRHNLSFPTALLHETGHQVSALVGLNDELAEALRTTLSKRRSPVAELWASWASEIAADVHAFLHTGWAPVMALANVVDGTTDQVFRIRPGDPHPFPWIRVMFNVSLCRSWFGAGPWDHVAAVWCDRHPLEAAGAAADVASHGLAAMDEIVDICTRRPMRAFRGVSFATMIDPSRVSPSSLNALQSQAGPSLLASSYLRRRDPIRILALLSTRALEDPTHAVEHRAVLTDWVRAIGSDGQRTPARSSAA